MINLSDQKIRIINPQIMKGNIKKKQTITKNKEKIAK